MNSIRSGLKNFLYGVGSSMSPLRAAETHSGNLPRISRSWPFIATVGTIAGLYLYSNDRINLFTQAVDLGIFRSLFGRRISMKNIEKSEAVFQRYTQTNFYRDLASNPNYADFKNKRFEQGTEVWDNARYDRSQFFDEAKQIIGSVFQQHVPKDSKILEVGSNQLVKEIGYWENEKDILSHLAELLPDNYRKHLIYSDYIPSVVEPWSKKLEYNAAECARYFNTYFSLMQNNANAAGRSVSEMYPSVDRKYRYLDLRDPNQNLEDGPQDVITGINVADVMKREDLPRFAQGAHRNLKDNGKVILLADRPFHMAPFLAKYSDKDDLAFLWCEEKQENGFAKSGVKIVKKQDLQPVVDRLDSRHRAHFQNIMNLTPAQRHHYFIMALINGLHDWDFLDRITQDIPHRRVEQVTSYEKDVIQAFVSNGFKLIEYGFKEQTSIIYDKTDFGIEKRFDPRGSGTIYSKKLAGKSITKAGFHVMIFQKMNPVEK